MLENLQNTFKFIHTFLVIRKNLIINGLLLLAFIFALFLPFGFYAFGSQQMIYFFIMEIAGKFGQMSLLLFLLTLIPGIISRLRISFLSLPAASITLFRRQLGILMYVFALIHMFYLNTIPFFLNPNFDPTKLEFKHFAGTLSVLILFPVFITSNDWSMQKLGIFWKTIQRLTYIAMIFIFLHVALMLELPLALLTLIVIGLEVYSWIKLKFF